MARHSRGHASIFLPLSLNPKAHVLCHISTPPGFPEFPLLHVKHTALVKGKSFRNHSSSLFNPPLADVGLQSVWHKAVLRDSRKSRPEGCWKDRAAFSPLPAPVHISDPGR